MTKPRDYTAKFQCPDNSAQKIQNSYIEELCALDSRVVTSLPLGIYKRIALPDFENGSVSTRIFDLLVRDEVTTADIITALPLANTQTVAADFAAFKNAINEWSEDYCCNKAWLIESACFTLSAFIRMEYLGLEAPIRLSSLSKGKTIAYAHEEQMLTVIIPLGNGATTRLGKIGVCVRPNPFMENYSEYEARVKQALKEAKKNWLAAAKEIYSQKTKSRRIEGLTWLAMRNVKKWSDRTIALNEFKYDKNGNRRNAASLKRIENKIYSSVRQFADFDLPFRENVVP